MTRSRARPIVAPPVAPLQEEQRLVFRASTEAVQVDVFVGEDRTGGSRDSARPDFELYDDGELRTIDSVTVAELPLNVVLVLDTSASVKGETLSHLQPRRRPTFSTSCLPTIAPGS